MTPDMVHFPEGLPGFESCRRYVVMAGPSFEPFCSLQGQGADAPAFVTIDPRRVAPDFPCALDPTDRARLHLSPDETPDSTPLLWLAIASSAFWPRVRPLTLAATATLNYSNWSSIRPTADRATVHD